MNRAHEVVSVNDVVIYILCRRGDYYGAFSVIGWGSDAALMQNEAARLELEQYNRSQRQWNECPDFEKPVHPNETSDADKTFFVESVPNAKTEKRHDQPDNTTAAVGAPFGRSVVAEAAPAREMFTVLTDPVADALDDMAALGLQWMRNRERGRMPSGIRAAMLFVAREMLDPAPPPRRHEKAA